MALTTGRNTARRALKRFSFPVAGNATVYGGGMVSLLNSGGWAVPAGTASSGNAVGIAEDTVNGGGTNGLFQVTVDRDCGLFENSAGGDEITHLDIGQIAYIVDDETVAKTDNSGARMIAGTVVGVVGSQVWVDVGPGAVGPRGPQGEPGE